LKEHYNFLGQNTRTMKLGTRGRYAVMALLDLALREKGGPVPLSDISDRQFISLSYLEQIFNKLRRHGIVRSVRGAGGGYHLNREKKHITIADVILAVDEPIKATRCSPHTGKGCMLNGAQCITHHLWDDLGSHIIHYLKGITLQDVLLKNESHSKSNAFFERVHA
jgi:Rrf2 family iron-sulfur cluster assembly transcriptional regulator